MTRRRKAGEDRGRLTHIRELDINKEAQMVRMVLTFSPAGAFYLPRKRRALYRPMICCTVTLLMMASLTFGQTFEVKDRNGALVLSVANVKLFRYSDYFKKEIADFQGTIKNLSGESLLRVSITGIVHKKDGSVVEFTPDVCRSPPSLPPRPLYDCDENSIYDSRCPFGQPSPFTSAEFESLNFRLDSAERIRRTDGFHVSGFIAKDEGCFSDYLATRSLTGVALRKKLVELVEYGCGFVLDRPLQAKPVEFTKKAFGTGPKKVVAILVSLFDERLLVGNPKDPSPYSTEFGWVLVSALDPGPVLTTEQIGVGVAEKK